MHNPCCLLDGSHCNVGWLTRNTDLQRIDEPPKLSAAAALNESCFFVTLCHMGLDRVCKAHSTHSWIPDPPTTVETSTMVGQTLRSARHILICLRYGIGDIVMQLPLLNALRQTVPNARITGFGAAPAIELLDGSGLVDEIVALGRWGIRHFWEAGVESVVSQLACWLKDSAFDLVLDAEYAPQPVAEAVERARLGALSTDQSTLLAALAGGANSAEALSRAAHSGWGLPVDAHVRPTIALADSEIQFAQTLLVLDSSKPAQRFVGLCPAASSKLKRWPEERFVTLADWAIESGHRPILLKADLDESTPGMQRLLSYGERVLVIRKLHLRRLAAVLAECAVLVCNDTGLMHMAAAVGIPVVAVFGPTSPGIYLPRGRTISLAGGVNCPHRSYNMDPPGCWASENCLIAPDNCTAAVHTQTVIAALASVLDNEPSIV
jgi:ADP-heptose:LPS heptosyltransferase